MKHKEMWLTIAEAYLTPEGERTEKQGGMTRKGLCLAKNYLGGDFHQVFDIHNPKGLFWLPIRVEDYRCSGDSEAVHTRGHDLIRGTFACLMAAMTKKEFDQLVASD